MDTQADVADLPHASRMPLAGYPTAVHVSGQCASFWTHERPLNNCVLTPFDVERATILLPRSPADLLVNGRTRIIATPNHALLLAAGARVSGQSLVNAGDIGDLISVAPQWLQRAVTCDSAASASAIDCLALPVSDSQFLTLRLLFRDRKRSPAGSAAADELILVQLLDVLRNVKHWHVEGIELFSRRPENRRVPLRRCAVEEIKRILVDHPDGGPRLAQLARATALSPYYLARVFHAETGFPTRRFAQTLKLRCALDGIISSSASLDDIAKANGFADCRQLGRALKLQFGFSPESLHCARIYA